MTDIIQHPWSWLIQFQFYYPLFMAYVWMIGALYYYYHWETGKLRIVGLPPQFPESPPVSVVVPCYNEAENIEETITFLMDSVYPNFDIIAVNDGSSDATAEILDTLCTRYEKLRVIHLAENQGKSMALRMAALMSPHDYLICIDGDALLDKYAINWMMSHLLSGSRVGAVTGNPRIRTRSTLLGKIQVGEFSAIIGLIKRAQRIYGRVFTVSGVVTAFRKAALHQAGYWSMHTVTDDIDVSWRMQLNHWDIRFEPNALCWILMPETLRGLWRQRLRWSQGGMEALIEHGREMFAWRKRRMWGVCIEYLTSIFWAYGMALVIVIWCLQQFIPVPQWLQVSTLLPSWAGVILGTTCLLQFAVSILIDSRYEGDMGRYYYWMIWYPMAYWILSVFTTVIAIPKALFSYRRKRGTWESPDRGLRP